MSGRRVKRLRGMLRENGIDPTNRTARNMFQRGLPLEEIRSMHPLVKESTNSKILRAFISLRKAFVTPIHLFPLINLDRTSFGLKAVSVVSIVFQSTQCISQ